MVRGQALSVLLVEDDPGDVMMITEALEARGDVRQTHVAGDGLEALAFLRRMDQAADGGRPDIILLDLNMPRMDGRETLVAIKNDAFLATIPVVILSTSSARKDINFSYLHHASAYVIKPMDFAELFHAVTKIDSFYADVATLPLAER